MHHIAAVAVTVKNRELRVAAGDVPATQLQTVTGFESHIFKIETQVARSIENLPQGTIKKLRLHYIEYHPPAQIDNKENNSNI